MRYFKGKTEYKSPEDKSGMLRVFGSVIFPLLLLLWPLVSARQGVSIMDTTYSLGNYRYLGPDAMWFFATFLANAVGRIFASLSIGRTMIGMNVLCLLLQSLTALIPYYYFKNKIGIWPAFLGEWIALSLCWCPAAILYNYLTYLCLTIGTIFLYRAIQTDRSRWYALAGIVLGLGVAVRFSNLTQAALIAALWFWCYLEKKSLPDSIKRTGLCIAGYAAGFGSAVCYQGIRYGFDTYLEKIGELFGATSGVESYTMGGMLSAILQAYMHSARWFVLWALCVIFGVVLFRLKLIQKKPVIGKILMIAVFLVLIRFYWGRGMFTTNYSDYWSMFEWGMLGILAALFIFLAVASGLWKADHRERFLAVAMIVQILILPIGSNNYTFPILNCLFLIAPLGLYFAIKQCRKENGIMSIFPVRAGLCVLVLGLLVQGSLFHVMFAFRDGTDGTARSAKITQNTVAKGMYTVPDNAKDIDDLSVFLEGRGDGSAIVFGNAPGIHYLMELPPALSTTWMDLDSYPTEQLQTEVTALENAINSGEGVRPVVIIHEEESAQSASSAEKYEILQGFLTRNDYKTVYESENYLVME